MPGLPGPCLNIPLCMIVPRRLGCMLQVCALGGLADVPSFLACCLLPSNLQTGKQHTAWHVDGHVPRH